MLTRKNIDMQPIKMKQNITQKVIHPIPPYNGWGSEEDSLYSVYNLGPGMPAIKRVNKPFKNDRHILRFNAKLISTNPADSERTFIISYFCGDDMVMVFEVADKNSGRLNCKFLEKQLMKNPYSKQYYTEKEFVVGNIVYLNHYSFKLLECDEYTKKYMKDNPEVFRDSNLNSVIERVLKPAKLEKDDFLVNLLTVVDPENNGSICGKLLIERLKELSCN